MSDNPPLIFLSYTAAKRYADCAFLQYAHKTKQVKKAPNELPFFVGRVVHTAAETWLHRRGTAPMATLIGPAWAKEEAEVVAAGTVIWSPEKRTAEWDRAVLVATTLERMLEALRITALKHVAIEQKFSTVLDHATGAAMYAQADILALSNDGTTGYLCELKSGKSYDPSQPPWYVAVIERDPTYANVQRWLAVPLRPAVSDTVTPVDVVPLQREEQRQRVRSIVNDMQAGKWDPSPGWYCNTCEAKNVCPSYQRTYGHLQRGRVGLGR